MHKTLSNRLLLYTKVIHSKLYRKNGKHQGQKSYKTFVCFLGGLKPSKISFEIFWPLLWMLQCTEFFFAHENMKKSPSKVAYFSYSWAASVLPQNGLIWQKKVQGLFKFLEHSIFISLLYTANKSTSQNTVSHCVLHLGQ